MMIDSLAVAPTTSWARGSPGSNEFRRIFWPVGRWELAD